MKVLYDPQIFMYQKYGGISRYFYKLLDYFYQTNEVSVSLPILFTQNHYLKDVNFSSVVNLEDKKFPFKKQLVKPLNSLNKIYAKNSIKKQNYDIIHPTYYDPYFIDSIGNKPFVITVYDLIFEKFPQFFGQDKNIEYKKILAQKAAKIIAISESTKQDLIEILNIDEAKIDVVYLANSFDKPEFQSISDNVVLPSKYILWVGDRWHYKNFQPFLKAIESVLKADKELKLVCAGSRPFNKEELSLINELGLNDNVIRYEVTDKLIVQLYQNARAFVFASLYEGFGIPVLESYSCGCPLIVSNTSSLPEVAGDACEYFDPYDLTSMKIAIEKVIYNDTLRKELVEKGFEQLKKFNWKTTAIETKKVYESVL